MVWQLNVMWQLNLVHQEDMRKECVMSLNENTSNRWKGMSHVTHVNESWNRLRVSYIQCIRNISKGMGHVTHLNDSWNRWCGS